jgi:hypothetical protein
MPPTDPAFDAQILQRLIDWHDAPANAPRRLDLTLQDAVAFFGLPSDTPEVADTSWDRLYAALDPMVADGRVLGDLYVNRVRDLRPGYRGLRARDGDLTARMATDRAALDADRAALDTDRAALDAERARLDRMETKLAARTEAAARDAELLAVRAEKLRDSKAQVDARDAALADREAALDRETIAARRETANQQAQAYADLAAARRWRMAGVGMVVLTIVAGVAFAVTQGWI